MPIVHPDTCTRCGKPLEPKRKVWLELDQRDGTYHNFRDIPADCSQGWFAFGVACSRAMVRAARAVRYGESARR
jgi:hypothetical protein